MASDNRLFDDLARMAGGAASLISTVRRQVSSDLRERAHSYSSRMDIASQDEVERLQAAVSKFRVEQEQMKKRIADLEALLAGKANIKAASKAPAKKKPAKTAKRK